MAACYSASMNLAIDSIHHKLNESSGTCERHEKNWKPGQRREKKEKSDNERHPNAGTPWTIEKFGYGPALFFEKITDKVRHQIVDKKLREAKGCEDQKKEIETGNFGGRFFKQE